MIPALFRISVSISEEFRKLLALLCKLGGMGIIDPTEMLRELVLKRTGKSIKKLD